MPNGSNDGDTGGSSVEFVIVFCERIANKNSCSLSQCNHPINTPVRFGVRTHTWTRIQA